MKLIVLVLSTSDFLHLDPGVVFINSWKDGQGLLMGGCDCHLVESLWANDFQMLFRSLDYFFHRNSMNFHAVPSTT